MDLRAITSRTSTGRTNLTFPMTTMGLEPHGRRDGNPLAAPARAIERERRPARRAHRSERGRRALRGVLGQSRTMLAATHARATGEASGSICGESAAWLIDQWDPQTDLWTQRFRTGSVEQYIGPAHGFAGCVLALIRMPTAPFIAVRRKPWLVRSRGGWARELEAERVDGEPAVQSRRIDPDAVVSRRAGHGDVAGSGGAGDDEHSRLLRAGGELTWVAGPLAKGANLCHGTAGNGYAFLSLLERTGTRCGSSGTRVCHACHLPGGTRADGAAAHYSLDRRSGNSAVPRRLRGRRRSAPTTLRL